MTAMISATSCARTKQLYDLIDDNCPTVMVLAVHERHCPRPARYSGVGFPVTGEVADTIPMLVDMRHDFLKDWSRINLVHDSSVDHKTLHDLVDGLASAEGPGITPASVMTYKVDISRKRVTSKGDLVGKDHAECMRSGSKERFSARHLTKHIESDPSLAYFVLIGGERTIETIVEEVRQTDNYSD